MRHILITLTVLMTLASVCLAVDPTPCSPCGCSGKCHVCEGDGQRNDGSTCSWCAGNKRCYYCSGAGKY
jgi:hypothetical protein